MGCLVERAPGVHVAHPLEEALRRQLAAPLVGL